MVGSIYQKRIPSTLDAVNAAVNEILELVKDQDLIYDQFSFDLLLRETLNNAVLHGNLNDPQKHVEISVLLQEDGISFEVIDEGSGWDWKDQIHAEIDPGKEHGRGFPILRTYAEQIELNDRGNRIRVYLKTAQRA